MDAERDPGMRNGPTKGWLCAARCPMRKSSRAPPNQNRCAQDTGPSEATVRGAFLYGSRPRAEASRGKCCPAAKLSSTPQIAFTVT